LVSRRTSVLCHQHQLAELRLRDDHVAPDPDAWAEGAELLSAAAGIAFAFALIRRFARRDAAGIGNFWADVVRVTIYLLLPARLFYALYLLASGVPQTLAASATATTLEGATQTTALGPVASQEAIKMLGTNDGGFFNANSAHPL